MTVDKNSLLPLYHQVEESLRHNIADRVYPPGQSIPERFALSRFSTGLPKARAGGMTQDAYKRIMFI